MKVYRFWEDNGTAYMVMPYLQGTTLRDTRRAMTASPDEAWIRGVLDPMLDALEQLHGEGVYHRDVAPDNILLPLIGAPILLDFGAARRVISDRTQTLTAILKPSYAPIEQYAEMDSMRQGPWTDLYALGAVMHFLLFGAPPAPATARAVQDDTGQIEQRSVPGVSPRFMSLVAWMLNVRPIERPQNVATVRAALRGEIAIPTRVPREVTVPGDTALLSVAHGAPVPRAATQLDPAYAPTQRVAGSYSDPTRIDTAHQPTEVLRRPEPAPAIQAPSPDPVTMRVPPPKQAAAAPAAAVPKASGGKGLVMAGVAVVVIVGGVAAWKFGGPKSAPAVQEAPTTAPAAAPVVATPDVGPSIANVASVPQWGGGASAPRR